MEQQSPILIVNIAFNKETKAKEMGKQLVEKQLAACCQIYPVQSIYRWKGKVISEDEFILQAKTVKEKLEQLEGFVKENHDYEVPEILAIPVAWAHAPYTRWVKDNTGF